MKDAALLHMSQKQDLFKSRYTVISMNVILKVFKVQARKVKSHQLIWIVDRFVQLFSFQAPYSIPFCE